MTHKRFEGLPDWSDAVALAARAFALRRDAALRRLGNAASPLERAEIRTMKSEIRHSKSDP